jgi:hypothetical protein
MKVLFLDVGFLRSDAAWGDKKCVHNAWLDNLNGRGESEDLGVDGRRI